MSDLRLTARCLDCEDTYSGSEALVWVAEHLELLPNHRVAITGSGWLGNVGTHESPSPAARSD